MCKTMLALCEQIVPNYFLYARLCAHTLLSRVAQRSCEPGRMTRSKKSIGSKVRLEVPVWQQRRRLVARPRVAARRLLVSRRVARARRVRAPGARRARPASRLASVRLLAARRARPASRRVARRARRANLLVGARAPRVRAPRASAAGSASSVTQLRESGPAQRGAGPLLRSDPEGIFPLRARRSRYRPRLHRARALPFRPPRRRDRCRPPWDL